VSLSFTPPKALYSADALPPSFRAWVIWGSVVHFGTNYLPADAPPPNGGLHFRVLNPALKVEPTPVLYPSALPGLNTYLKRNPLHQVLPSDAEDCPPEDQYVTPAIVARNVQPFLGLLPTPRRGRAARPQNPFLGLAVRTGHSSMSWRMPTGQPSPSCKVVRQQLNRWPRSKLLACLLPLGCKLFSVCAYPTLIRLWACQPWMKEPSTVVLSSLPAWPTLICTI